jgi:signal transduction histidine kinase
MRQRKIRGTRAETVFLQGSGLNGLTEVRSILSRHGGRVIVRSTPGWGSCFTLPLPACGEEDRGTDQGKESPVSEPGRGSRIP